jgi:hypothetical protein
MTISEPRPRAASTAELRAAEEAYYELKQTWAAFQQRWVEALPDILTGETWKEWLGDDELRRLRAIVGEWVVAGDDHAEHERQAATALSWLGPRIAHLMPPELRVSYARAAELSLFLIEQMSAARDGGDADASAGTFCGCGVAVPPESVCSTCGDHVCVLHSLPHPLRDDGARICRRCAARR